MPRSLATVLSLLWMTAMWPAERLLAAEGAQVNAAIQRGNAYLLGQLKDVKGGGKSLAAYALIKTGTDKAHPAIQEAIADALDAAKAIDAGQPEFGPPDSLGHREFGYTIPCHIFLLEAADGKAHKSSIAAMAGFLSKMQLANGSWFYADPPGGDVGDTSQLQFVLLGLWAASRAEVDPQPETWQKAVNWLVRTQMSDGGFCYQPKSTYAAERETSLSTTLGGLGSLLVARYLFYGSTQFGEEVVELTKPKTKRFGVLERLQDEKERKRNTRPFTVPVATIDKSISRALKVVDEKFRVTGDQALFQMYILYSMERTAALLDSETLGKHNWYDDASDELLLRQLKDGSWADRSGPIPSTSFALLALSKTTSKILERSPGKKIGGGLLAGARGLPDDLTKLQLKDGQAAERKSQGAVDDLLADLEKVQDVRVEDIQKSILETVNLDQPEQLVGQLDRLRRLAVDPRADVRRTALWAIGRTGEIRLAALLIAGLEDVDVDVMREASYGLTVLSRKPTGLIDDRGRLISVEPLEGVEEDATEEDREAAAKKWSATAVAAWKKWYFSVRPYDERDDRQELRKMK